MPSKGTRTRNSGWRPGYLQRRVLAAFIVTFAAIIAVLEALSHISQANDGIASSAASRHYSWTYGPTAILTVVAAVWSRVEFQARQRAPWQAMHAGPTAASQSVLLDYISPLQPVALWKACKNRHFAVVAAVACSMLLRLIVVFSTGLFALQEVALQKEGVEVRLLDAFSGTNISANPQMAPPFDILNSVLFRNGTYPEGTTKDLVYQRFSVPEALSDAIVTVPVDGLAPQLDCESADLELTKWRIDNRARKSDVNENSVISSSCRLVNIMMPTALRLGAQYISKFQTVQCNDTTGLEGRRLLALVAETHEPVIVANDTVPLGAPPAIAADFTFSRSVQVLCKPSYSLINLHSTNNASDSNVHLQRIGSDGVTLPGLSGWDIAYAVLAGGENTTMNADRPIKDHDPFYSTDGTRYAEENNVIDHLPIPLQMGGWLANKTGDIGILFDEDVLQDIVGTYYRAMATQFLRRGIDQERPSTAIGSAVVNDYRVLMTQVPLRVIEVCLAIGILLAIWMVIQTSRSNTQLAPWNPNSISGIAAIVAHSQGLAHSLAGSSAEPSDALGNRLAQRRYYSQQTTTGFSIEGVEENQGDPVTVPKDIDPDGESKPFPSLIVRIAIFLVVVLTIVALEVVLHVSHTNDGLGYAPNNEYVHYLWTVIPALLMVAIRLAFGSIDFNVRSLAPYAHLKRPAGATFAQFMTVDFKNSLDITVVVNSIRTRHFAVLATTLAAFITPFLTIVTSGLYSPLDVPQLMTADFARGDPAAVDDADASILTALYILRGNLSYPRWTHEDLAFPHLELGQPLQHELFPQSFVDISVPALRGAPICQLWTGSHIPQELGPDDTYDYRFNIMLPTVRCTPDSANQSTRGENVTLYFSSSEEQTFGKSGEATCYGDDIYDHANPVIYYAWGHYSSGKFPHLALMQCAGAAELVNTRTRFRLPNFDFAEGHPPVPDESSVTPAANQSVALPTFGNLASEAGGLAGAHLDVFFESLVEGKYGILEADLGAADGIDRVVKAIKFQNRVIMAQTFTNYSSIANASLPASYPGDVFIRNRLRLFQDATSTRVLDALLASILMLGVLGSFLLNTDHILPKNPSSVAAVASLLADSNFLSWYRSTEADDPNGSGLARSFFAQRRFFIRGSRDRSTVDSSSTEAETDARMADDFTICLGDPVEEKRLAGGEIGSEPDLDARDVSQGSGERG
ncbi:hypothetical protein FE257_007146 [Aspergillus nanangensis]|uniref:Uncharacterized protein n=1 Tax=Aspergillus nanangensis TaxID=2582783 RepID=A0AAD4CPX5_ASPNN|nr:hypothetical protein FE257_007146 [Aspergillus nanangensis]